MFERWTDRAKRIAALAEQEAMSRGHDRIGTEHILHALVNEGTSVALRVLEELGIDRRELWLKLYKTLDLGAIPVPRLGWTPAAKKLRQGCIEEAKGLGHNYVGTEHLLLALLRDQDDPAAQVLMSLGARIEDTRKQVVSFLETSRAASEHATPSPKFASKTVIRARQAAEKEFFTAGRQDAINTGHMLLSFLSEPQGIAARALARLGVDQAQLHDQLTQLLDSDREE